MLVRKSQQALFFQLLLFAGLIDCSIWAGQNNVILPPVSLPPSNPPFTPIRPDQPYQPNQPFPNSSFGCQSTCTMSVSVSQDCLLYFQRLSKMSVSQSLCTTGLKSPRIRLVFLQVLAHPRLPFPQDSLRNYTRSLLIKDIRILIPLKRNFHRVRFIHLPHHQQRVRLNPSIIYDLHRVHSSRPTILDRRKW